MKIVDWPGTMPVGLFYSLNVLDPPIVVIWGYWWLEILTLHGPLMLPPIPGTGVEILSGTLPLIPGPYDIYFQSLQDIPLKLTNLCIMHVD
jgi:hypothetical protein